MSQKSSISVSKIKEGLKTHLFGSEILLFDEVESTNELAKRYPKQREGLVIIADSQTKGKGRSGRSWYSPKGSGVYLSVLLKPQTENPSPLTLMAGVACLTYKEPSLSLKWPNDILVDGKKMAGILCELCDEKSKWLVLGIGINANQLHSDFPDSLQGKAISLKMKTGKSVDKVDLIRSLIFHLDHEYKNWLLQGSPNLVKRWSDQTKMLGLEITLYQGKSVFHGTAKRLDLMGRLVVITEKGEEMTFSSGEVTLNL